MDRPKIAITMGDPSGVGPEIIVKALSRRMDETTYLPLVIGDSWVLEKAARLADCGFFSSQIRVISVFEEWTSDRNGSCIWDLKNVPQKDFAYGAVRPEFGRAATQYIHEAVKLALQGHVDAIVTCPIQKESFKAGGSPYPGHTEMLAALTGAKNAALMLMVDDFRVLHVTLHTALRDAIPLIARDRVFQVIEMAHEGCKALGISRPRIGVAGLNPHAGEGGLFGGEETEEIIPAIRKACESGMSAEGPFSSDTVFSLLKGGRFDIVVCMYHDQGGIPMKLLSFEWDKTRGLWHRIRGVNVTLGLPIIRTSVSHGTGFEIAGKGIADPTSLEEAIAAASLMVRVKQKTAGAVRS